MQSIQVPSIKQRYRELPVYCIKYLTGMENYSRIYYIWGKHDISSRTLKHYHQALPGFIRISKSVLINPAYCDFNRLPNQKNLDLYMDDGTCFQISRRRFQLVVQQLQETVPASFA